MSPLMLESAYFPLFTTTFLILIIFWKVISKDCTRLPPGPWKLPIIGNLHQLAAGDPLPHHALRDLANKHGPVMHLKLGQLETVIISSPKAAEQVLKTHDLTFAQRPSVLAVEVMSFGQGSMVFAPYGEFWRDIRKVCVLKLLNTKRVQFFRSIRAEEVSNLIESLSSKGLTRINLSKKILGVTNAIVARAAFGSKCKDQAKFIALLLEANKLAGGFGIADLFPSIPSLGYITGAVPSMKKLQKKFGDILEVIINDHMIKNHENEKDELLEQDFVDVLLKLQESKKLDLTTGQIKDVIMDMFGAGTETTATTIEWTLSELLRNPQAMKKIQAELRGVSFHKGKTNIEEEDIPKLHYLEAAVKETLRLHPPAPLHPREAIERCQIGGYEIPKKTRVITNLWALGRDPESWVDALSFKPERFMLDGSDSNVDFIGFDFQFLPFGTGRRICPGISFAIPLIQYALSQLLFHFDWKLTGDEGITPEELDMSETFGISCRRKSDLYVTATPHLGNY